MVTVIRGGIISIEVPGRVRDNKLEIRRSGRNFKFEVSDDDHVLVAPTDLRELGHTLIQLADENDDKPEHGPEHHGGVRI